MYSLAVGQQHDTEMSTFHLWNGGPATNATVRLNHLPFLVLDDILDPLQPNDRTIRTEPDRFEVTGEFQRPVRPISSLTSRTSSGNLRHRTAAGAAGPLKRAVREPLHRSSSPRRLTGSNIMPQNCIQGSDVPAQLLIEYVAAQDSGAVTAT